MSTLFVDGIQPEGATTTLTLGVSGDTISIPAGATLANSGTATGFPAAGFAGVDATTSTGSTTYTVPTGITKLLVFITGGGGGGAAGYTGISSGGGHAATTVIARVTVVAADTITIAIGAGGAGGVDGTSWGGVDGGNSTFTHASGSGSGSMSTITAPGGEGYIYQAAQPAPTAGTVGANNEGISILGGYGTASGTNGSGGASFWGGGGLGAIPSYQNPGGTGTAYGSGGGGGSSTASYRNAGAGANGVCWIMEFK